MKVYLNTSTGMLSLSSTALQAPTFSAKFGTTFDLEVMPDVDIAAASVGYFSLKETPSGLLLAHGAWAAPTRSDTGWLFSMNLTGEPLATLVLAASAPVKLQAEGTFIIAGKTRKSQSLVFTVERPVYVGDEEAPTEMIGQRRMGPDGYMQYTWDEGTTWRRYAPVLVGDVPEWQWSEPFTDS